MIFWLCVEEERRGKWKIYFQNIFKKFLQSSTTYQILMRRGKKTIVEVIYMLFPFIGYNISQFVIIQMNWAFNFSPYTFTSTPNLSFVLVPLQVGVTTNPTDLQNQENLKQASKQGISINLTVDQLKEAGYETNKKAWTEEEDKLLMSLFQKNSLSWKQIAQRIPGRTSKMCYSRYRRIESRSKEQWSRSQDAKIRRLVEIQGLNWQKICENFPKRTQKQVHDHYMNYLRPQINKEPWTLEEDLELINLLKNYGKDWVEIGKRLNGRTQNQIKNRYFGRLKRLEQRKREIQRESHSKDEHNV